LLVLPLVAASASAEPPSARAPSAATPAMLLRIFWDVDIWVLLGWLLFMTRSLRADAELARGGT
jgi:hypothetical protein